MLSKKKDRIAAYLNGVLQFAKYRYYYPIINRIYYQSHLKEANEIFAKSQQMREKKEVKIPLFVNEKHNKVFQEFCKSGITDYGFEKNKTSMCIVLGPSEIGKTTFIRQNLAKLVTVSKNKKHSDIDWFNITSFNCGSFGIINFDVFINNLESALISSCHKQFSKIVAQPDLFLPQQLLQENSNEIQFDAVTVIKDILYHSYAKEYLNLYARDMISSLLNDEEIALLIPDEIKPLLSEIYSSRMLEEYTDFSELFNDIVEVLKSSYQGDAIRTAIQLSVALLTRIEYENRPPISKDKYYRNGIIVNTFLLDLLNYLEGYHTLNTTSTQFSQNILVLENFDNLFKGYQNDMRFLNFQDHLLLRLYSDTRERDHFPLVIETSNSRFFSKELFEMMHIPFNTYGCIENYGIPVEQLIPQYSSIFSNREIDLLKRLIGTNTYTWTKLLETIVLTPNKPNKSVFEMKNLTKHKASIYKSSDKSSDNTTQNKQKVTFNEIIEMKTDFFDQEYVKFKSRIQSIYLDNTLAQLLDGVDVQDRDFHSDKKKKDPAENENIIKFYLLDTFETFIYNYGTLQLSSQYAQYRILENSVVKALLSANILYMRYYYSYIMFDKYIYNSFAKRYINELKSQMSLSQKFEYFIWRKRNGIEKMSLLLIEKRQLALEPTPENARDFNNFKLNPELSYFKGIDFEQETLTISDEIVERLAKK